MKTTYKYEHLDRDLSEVSAAEGACVLAGHIVFNIWPLRSNAEFLLEDCGSKGLANVFEIVTILRDCIVRSALPEPEFADLQLGLTNEHWEASCRNEGDGPASGFSWRCKGTVVDSAMQRAAWKMVNFIWQQSERRATFDELMGPVYGDVNHIADANAFGSLRRAANRFFKEHNIDLQGRVEGSQVSIVPVSETQ